LREKPRVYGVRHRASQQYQVRGRWIFPAAPPLRWAANV